MKEVVIGLLFVSALSVVLYLAFTLGGPGSLDIFAEETRPVKIRFPEVTGLKVKNDVLVSGVRKGSVTGMELQQDGSVVVLCSIERDAIIFADARAEMINVSALGGKAVAINPGTARAERVTDTTIIAGEYVPDFLNALGRIMNKVDTGLDKTIGVVEDLGVIMRDVKEGKGPAGAILRDQEMAENIRQMVSNLNEASTSIRSIAREVDALVVQVNSGRGTVSTLLYDEKLADDFKRGMESVRNAAADARELMRELRHIAGKVDHGDGIISAMLNDAAMRGDVTSAVRNADDAIVEVTTTFREAGALLKDARQGKGSMGKLLTDDALYNDFVRAINTLQASLEDLREQAPITTFASVVFSVFQ